MALSAQPISAVAPSLSKPFPSKCGKNCMGYCCLPGSAVPLYRFPLRDALRPQKLLSLDDLVHVTPEDCDSMSMSSSSSQGDLPEEALPGGRSMLDAVITDMWDDCADKGLFRYDITSSCITKTVAGSKGFIAQLNEGRHSKKRPTEFRVDQVLQPFDSAKFNFTKIGQQEVMLQFEPSDGDSVGFDEEAIANIDPNVVLINVSPIEYGHVLLVPKIHSHLPQQISAEGLSLAIHFVAEVDNPQLRVGYNSLGAFATVNHLHFQGYYLQQAFPIELAQVEMFGFTGKEGLGVGQLVDYPVRALVFEMGSSIEEMANVVGAVCSELQQKNMPFNIFIAERGSKLFLMPQCYASRQARGEVEEDLLETQVNPAVFEISGHIVLKRKEDYEGVDEAFVTRLLGAVSLSSEAFEGVKRMSMNALHKEGAGTQGGLSCCNEVAIADMSDNEEYSFEEGEDQVVPGIQFL